MLEANPAEAFAYFVNLVFFVPIPERIPEEIVTDRFDNLFLALAAHHSARFIISGDRHF